MDFHDVSVLSAPGFVEHRLEALPDLEDMSTLQWRFWCCVTFWRENYDSAVVTLNI